MNVHRLLLLGASCAVVASPAFGEGQGHRAHHAEAAAETPLGALASANDASRQRPSRQSFQEARYIYSYEPGAIYELYTNPNYVSTILLETGETLNNIAAGDTSRWMVTQAEGETDSEGRTIVLVKPQAANLRTNIVLITDRRTYLVEAISQTGAVYSAQVAWRYPLNTEVSPAPSAVANLNFDYRVRTVRGRAPVWAPSRVFDDGHQTWVEFGPGVAASDMPPLFVITPDGAELVNYRVQGQRYMVDRIFDIAELRLGTRAPIVVRIERNPHNSPVPPMRLGPRS
jgi:P-type conjugative transfer protein TrbG